MPVVVCLIKLKVKYSKNECNAVLPLLSRAIYILSKHAQIQSWMLKSECETNQVKEGDVSGVGKVWSQNLSQLTTGADFGIRRCAAMRKISDGWICGQKFVGLINWYR